MCWPPLQKKSACSLLWLPGLPLDPNQFAVAPLPVKMTPVPVTSPVVVRIKNPPQGCERELGMKTTGRSTVPLISSVPMFVMSTRGSNRTMVPAPIVNVAPAERRCPPERPRRSTLYINGLVRLQSTYLGRVLHLPGWIGCRQKARTDTAFDLNRGMTRRGQHSIPSNRVTLLIFDPCHHWNLVPGGKAWRRHDSQMSSCKFVRGRVDRREGHFRRQTPLGIGTFGSRYDKTHQPVCHVTHGGFGPRNL